MLGPGLFDGGVSQWMDLALLRPLSADGMPMSMDAPGDRYRVQAWARARARPERELYVMLD